jgi:hypothetical protein
MLVVVYFGGQFKQLEPLAQQGLPVWFFVVLGQWVSNCVSKTFIRPRKTREKREFEEILK